MNDINPFIRHCDVIPFGFSSQGYTMAYDCRIFYSLNGSIEIKSENNTYMLNKNALLYIPPKKEYHINNIDFDMVKVLVLNFDLYNTCSHITSALSPDYVFDFDERRVTLIPDIEPFDDIIYLENSVSLEEQFLAIYNEFKLHRPDYQAACSGYLKLLLTLIKRNISQSNGYMPPILNNVVNYINNNYMRSITQSDINELFHYHPYYINRLFNRYMSQTMHQYIIKQRISAAKQLILYSNSTLEEIAYNTGFKSASYFSQCFKKHIGIYPSEYKRKSQNLLI